MPQAPPKRKGVRDGRLIASDASDASDSACDNALTAGKCPFILAPVMGITRQAGKMNSGAWCQAARGRRAEGGVLRDFVFARAGLQAQVLAQEQPKLGTDFVFPSVTLSQTYC
jgi:hypothetical protein